MFDKVVGTGQSRHVRFVQWETADELRSRLIDVLVSELKLPDGGPALSGADDIAGFDATLGGEPLRDPLIFPYEINKKEPFLNRRLALE